MIDAIFTPLLLSLLAGLSTTIGALAVFFVKGIKPSFLSLILGFSAGVMIFISFTEFLKTSIENIGFLYANIGFFVGIIIIFLLDLFIPHIYKCESKIENNKLKLGMLVALGIAIHNFPEGIAVSVSTLSNLNLGILVALAIALHNIPEGLSVSFPIYYATKNKKKAFWYSFLSGLAEPIGAIVCLIFLYPFINQFNLNFMFAIVAGIMVFISLDELLPACLKQERSHLSILGLFAGMFVMAISMYFSGIV